MLDCAKDAAWLLVTDSGGAALSAVDTKSRRVMYREVTELGLADLSEILRRVEQEEARDAETITRTRSFEERCRAVSGGRHIYAMRRTLSLCSHATSSVADVYLETVRESEDAPLGVAMLLSADWTKAQRGCGYKPSCCFWRRSLPTTRKPNRRTEHNSRGLGAVSALPRRFVIPSPIRSEGSWCEPRRRCCLGTS